MHETTLLTPIRAIRKHCLKCASSPKEVRLCIVTDCSLYSYRMGKNPRRQGIGPGFIRKLAVESAKAQEKGVLNA